MKNLFLLLSLGSFSSLAQSLPVGQTGNPVVIELFTSQGCSSCPAADKNLAEIIEASEKNGQPVYGLSFHVDYWNYIGWKDPYSNAEYTERQKKYSLILNSESVYTPQMIVNGEVEFVGSNKKESNLAVSSARTKKMEYDVFLGVIEKKGTRILVTYSLSKIPVDIQINAALVEKKVENEVLRGENSGRKLTHRNVVRAFISYEAKKEATIEIGFPKGLSANSLIVFVQDRQGHILGATGTNFN